MPTTRSRVDCGFSLGMLSFCPPTRLGRVDLPALGRPTTVTIPALVMGGKVQPPRSADNAMGSDATSRDATRRGVVLRVTGQVRKRTEPPPLGGGGSGIRRYRAARSSR